MEKSSVRPWPISTGRKGCRFSAICESYGDCSAYNVPTINVHRPFQLNSLDESLHYSDLILLHRNQTAPQMLRLTENAYPGYGACRGGYGK